MHPPHAYSSGLYICSSTAHAHTLESRSCAHNNTYVQTVNPELPKSSQSNFSWTRITQTLAAKIPQLRDMIKQATMLQANSVVTNHDHDMSN